MGAERCKFSWGISVQSSQFNGAQRSAPAQNLNLCKSGFTDFAYVQVEGSSLALVAVCRIGTALL